MRHRTLIVVICLLGFALGWLIPDALLTLVVAAPKRPAPALGAFTAPVTIHGTVSGQAFTWSGTVTFSPLANPAMRSVSGSGPFTTGGTPPPPPPPPAPLTISSVTPNPVLGGATFTVMGTGFDTSAVVTWSGMRVTLQSSTTTALTLTAPVVSADTSGALVVTTAAGSVSGPALTVKAGVPPPPPPPPGTLIDVTTRGVVNDGKTIIKTALNNLISTAPAGATLYFPSGSYLTDDTIKVFRPNINFLGDGDTSIIRSVSGSYHFQVGSGQPYTGITFRKLQLYGTPGQYMSDGTSRGGILNFGSKGTVFEDLLFTGCAEPILAAGVPGTTAGAIINRVRFNGWGRMCVFANGGEQITHCQFIQDDPNLLGERSSHGVYSHGGASNVLIADCVFQNVRKYCIQIFSESGTSTSDNVQIQRCVFRDSANGVIASHGRADAGIWTHGLLEGCTFSNIYAGSSIAIRNADGVIVRNNVIDGAGSANGHSAAGIYVGVYAPWEGGFWTRDVLVQGNTIRGCDRGLWALNSNGGTLENIRFQGNIVSGNRLNVDVNVPGVALLPGRAPGAAKVRDSAGDTKPSDDRSAAAKDLR